MRSPRLFELKPITICSQRESNCQKRYNQTRHKNQQGKEERGKTERHLTQSSPRTGGRLGRYWKFGATVPPHPGPLPWGEGNTFARLRACATASGACFGQCG